MATKSTKNHSKRPFKIILIFLSCIFFFEGAFSLQKLADFYSNAGRNSLYLNNASFLDVDSYNLLGSLDSNFANKVTSDTRLVIDLAEKYISDAAVEDGTAFAAREKELRQDSESNIAAEILEQKKRVIEEKYEYDYEKECYVYKYAKAEGITVLDNFTSDEQVKADDASNGITTVGGVEYYKGYPIDAAIVDEAYIRAQEEEELKNTIIGERATFKAEYKNTQAVLGSRKNFQYFLVDKQTGTIYSNMGINSITDMPVEDLKNNGYSVSIINSELEMSSLVEDSIRAANVYYYGDTNYLFDNMGDCVTRLFSGNIDTDRYDIFIHVNTDAKSIIEGDDYYELYKEFEGYKLDFRQDTVLFAISAVLWLVSLVVLTIIAGERDENGNIKYTPIDKLPNSIHFIISGCLVCGIIAGCALFFWDYVYYYSSKHEWFVLTSTGVAIANALLIEWLMSVSRHVKGHRFLKNSLIYLLIIRNYKKIKEWYLSDNNKVFNKSIRRRILIPSFVYLVVSVLLSISIGSNRYYGATLWSILSPLLLIASTVGMAYYIYRLAAGIDSINSALDDAEQGNFEYKVSTVGMPLSLVPLAEKTNNLTNGIKVAVDEGVKNERMKTELITNVSHDLKTPLTSIITYTDLLKHCKIEDEKAIEYIGVLDEKSERLKKLIEDLVEASKASSGAISLVLAQINLNELIEQVFGEYEDALLEQNLDLRYNIPEEPAVVVADGQKTYRIIENLFSNVKKYAMHGTRVYLDLTTDDKFAIISMKNVSRDEMNFSAEHLTERFVRGDVARSTEGSGLGLSIARSLTELQGGKFDIDIDGDLFKVVISLPIDKNK